MSRAGAAVSAVLQAPPLLRARVPVRLADTLKVPVAVANCPVPEAMLRLALDMTVDPRS